MNLVNIIIVAVIVLILGGAVFYIVREKKRGTKCIGCPAGKTCSSGDSSPSGGCGCGGH